MAFQFSDVNIPFKAEVAGAIKSILNLKNTLVDFGKQVNKLGDQLNGPAIDKFGNSLKALDFRTLRAIDRLSLLVVMSRNVKGALDQMFGATSMVSKGFESMSEGAMVFTSIAQVVKTNLGLIAAGAAGLAVAVILFTTALVQANIKAIDASTDTTEKMAKIIEANADALKDATASAEAFGDTMGEVASMKLSMARQQFESTGKQIRDLDTELKNVTKTVEKLRVEEGLDAASKAAQKVADDTMRSLGMGPGFGQFGKAPPGREGSTVLQQTEDQANAIRAAMERLKKQQQDIVNNAAFLRLAEQSTKYTTALKNLNIELDKLTAINPDLEKFAATFQQYADFGVDLTEEQRIENAQKMLRIHQQILETTLRDSAATMELYNFLNGRKLAGEVLTPQEQAELDRLMRDEVPHHESRAEDARKNVEDSMKELEKATSGQKFTQAFTIPFTNAIGDAVINGLVQGKKGAEILADVMSNLFTAGLNDVMKRFQQGMIDVFKSIAGAGGELLGSALITVVGVVAGVLSRRGSSSDTFERIKNQIESTQAVRGVVAGPTNIAIAAVGENIKRALSTVEQQLSVIIQIMLRSSNSGLPYAGSVSTP